MNGSEDLIPLLYRADWTRWSVSASVVVRWSRSLTTPYRAQATSRLLIAPAGRYRYEPVGGRGIPGLADEDQVTLIVCDGHSCWVIRGREGTVYSADHLWTPMDDIVRPSWLLAGLTLRPQGTTTRDGRAVHQVRGLPRLPRGGRALRTAPCDYVDMLVDAELGLVLRLESVFGGRTRRVVELRDLTVDPPQADDPAAFRPPPGTDIDGEFGGGGPPDFGLEVDASERDPSRSWPGTTDVPFGMGALARSSAHAHRSTF